MRLFVGVCWLFVVRHTLDDALMAPSCSVAEGVSKRKVFRAILQAVRFFQQPRDYTQNPEKNGLSRQPRLITTTALTAEFGEGFRDASSIYCKPGWDACTAQPPVPDFPQTPSLRVLK